MTTMTEGADHHHEREIVKCKPQLSFSIERILYGDFKTTRKAGARLREELQNVRRVASQLKANKQLAVLTAMNTITTSSSQRPAKVSSNLHETSFREEIQPSIPANLLERYEWLGFTRYNPPKLPKSSKRKVKKKRKPGRNPRVPFTTKQLTALEAKFQKMKYLPPDEVGLLCKALMLPENRIKIWFQNRRAREKKKCQEEQIIDVIS